MIFFNYNWFNIPNDRYIYINNQSGVCLLTRIKKPDIFKIQAISYACSESERKIYAKTNEANV